MPEVDALAETFDAERVLVVGAATADPARIRSLRAQHGLAIPLPNATTDWRNRAGIEAFPEVLLVDARGRVAEHVKGPRSPDYLGERVRSLLAEADGAAFQACEMPEQAQARRHGARAWLFYRLWGGSARGTTEADGVRFPPRWHLSLGMGAAGASGQLSAAPELDLGFRPTRWAGLAGSAGTLPGPWSGRAAVLITGHPLRSTALDPWLGAGVAVRWPDLASLGTISAGLGWTSLWGIRLGAEARVDLGQDLWLGGAATAGFGFR